ncbi:MAG: DUF1579 family protein [Planctomycetota bacterium]
MSHTLIRSLLASSFILPLTLAQEPDSPVAVDEVVSVDPVTEHHRALSRQVGTWRVVYRTEAIPGIPGMEKATESDGIETIDLLGGGLWLRSVTQSHHEGQNFEGYWIVGYDPNAKAYDGIWVSSMEEPPARMRGSFDARRLAWTFEGNTGHGRMRSQLVMESDDESVETCWILGEDQAQTQCMVIRRTRLKEAPKAAVPALKAASDKVHPLGLGLGDWKAKARHDIPGMPPQESECAESVRWVCGGHWTWSDFSGEMMGMPFTGHALSGFDATTGKLVSYWIDSWTPTFTVTSGEFDAKSKTLRFTGSTHGPDGSEVPVLQTLVHSSEKQRRLTMQFGEGDEASKMTIDYTLREPSNKAEAKGSNAPASKGK